MNASQRRLLPVILGAAITMILAILVIRARYQLETTRERLRVHALLEAESAELQSELYRGESPLSKRGAAGHWHAWRLVAAGYRDTGEGSPPISAATLSRALSMNGATAAILGPFATDEGRDAIVVATPERPMGGEAAWSGSWSFIDDVISHTQTAELMKQGLRLQLYDSALGAALFQTDHGTLDTPVKVPLRFRGTSLELRAAPRGGWSAPGELFNSSLLVLLAGVLWLSSQRGLQQAARNAVDELAESQARRRELNLSYGKALERLAALESRLHLVSMFDTVTGLGNRGSLIREIDARLDSMRQGHKAALSVMAVGFDHMPHIASSFGAEFASRVLVIAAERVEFVLPAKNLLFRTGDFQLAIVLPETDAAQSQELARRLVDEIASPIALDGHTFMLHPSIGIAEAPTGYEYADSLLDRASAALGAVPSDALTRLCLFDSATARESISRLQLEVDLDRAFEEDQFVLEYEPFVVAGTRAVAGFEALIRWDHPTEGRLLPGRFLPIAAQAGMSNRLNAWVMRAAARQASLWHQAGYRDLFVNFNLSADAFLQPDLIEQISQVLAELDLSGEHLIIELTESTLVEDIRGAARTLRRLGEIGVSAWLDDFGTGYSSLSHLRTLPLKGVKIDQSFMERVVADARDFGFLKALIDLISYLGMQSIVEGVETSEQHELLSMTSCDLYQGHYFSRSMPAAQAEKWLRAATGAAKSSLIA